MSYLDANLPRVPSGKTLMGDFWKYLAEIVTNNGWAYEAAEVVYVDASNIYVAGDMSAKYTGGRTVWFNETFRTTVSLAVYDTLNKRTQVTFNDAVVPNPLNYVHLGLDIATLPATDHAALLNVRELNPTDVDTTRNKHVANADGKRWDDHVAAEGNLHNTTPGDIGAEPEITKNTAFNKNFGTNAGEVCQGNDARLSDSRTPTAHNHDQADVTGLVDALAGKAAAGHNHDANYAAAGHAHAGVYEPADPDILKSDTTAVLTKGFTVGAVPAMADSPDPTAGMIQTRALSANLNMGLMTGTGGIIINVTGAYTLTPHASYKLIGDEYDASVGGGATMVLIYDGTTYVCAIKNWSAA